MTKQRLVVYLICGLSLAAIGCSDDDDDDDQGAPVTPVAGTAPPPPVGTSGTQMGSQMGSGTRTGTAAAGSGSITPPANPGMASDGQNGSMPNGQPIIPPPPPPPPSGAQ